jgi:hypothetical protein
MCMYVCVDEDKALCKLKKPCRPPDEIPAGGRVKRRVPLPDDFHCELNVTRLGSQVINAPGTGWRSVRIKDRTAVCRLGWCEVRVVQDVENFRAKLNVEGFRDAMDWIVLEHGKVHVDEFRPDHTVTTGIAQQVRAIHLTAGRRSDSTESRTVCGRWRRSQYSWKSKTAQVEIIETWRVLEIVINGIAAGDAIRNAELIGAAVPHTHRISSNDGRRRDSAIDLENAAQLPTAQRSLYKSIRRLRRGYNPQTVDCQRLTNVEV